MLLWERNDEKLILVPPGTPEGIVLQDFSGITTRKDIFFDIHKATATPLYDEYRIITYVRVPSEGGSEGSVSVRGNPFAHK